jgi:hypothetical protein
MVNDGQVFPDAGAFVRSISLSAVRGLTKETKKSEELNDRMIACVFFCEPNA